jgi:hypothetical protein
VRTCGDVVVAGAGVAASAVAVRLLSLGIRPVLLHAGRGCLGTAESLPETVLPLLGALGIPDLLERAQAVLQDGFENGWDTPDPEVRPGRFYHVNRSTLAGASRAAAVERGAVVLACDRLPAVRVREGGVRVSVAGKDHDFLAAVDATGRAACWSRPVRRRGWQVADLFQAPAGPSALRGRVIRVSGRWAYRIGLADATTVGVLSWRSPPLSEIDPLISRRLSLPAGKVRRLGRWPAFPQWSEAPVDRHRFAIGDAALALDPLAGGGVTFALASALAAATAIGTLRDSGANGLARQYYDDFVRSHRRAHLDRIGKHHSAPPSLHTGLLEHSPSPSAPPLPDWEPDQMHHLPRQVQFTAAVCNTTLQVAGSVVPGQAIGLPDGALVRWLGDFDLLLLRRWAQRPIPLPILLSLLVDQGYEYVHATTLIRWSLKREVLTSITTGEEIAGQGTRGNPRS